MKHVITGGAGFIGSDIADALFMQGDEVVIIDDLSSGRMQNIGQVLARDTVTFIQGSITDREFLQSSFKGADGIFHQAALASVPKSITDPARNPRGQRHRGVQRLSFCPGRRGPERSSPHPRPPSTGTSPGFRSGKRWPRTCYFGQ